MKEILRTTIRLYAEKPADREALRLLRQVREEQHLRYADAIVAAVNAHYGQARQGGFDHQQREEIRGIVREELAASLLRCAGQTPAETSKDANAPDETDLDNLLDMMGSRCGNAPNFFLLMRGETWMASESIKCAPAGMKR